MNRNNRWLLKFLVYSNGKWIILGKSIYFICLVLLVSMVENQNSWLIQYYEIFLSESFWPNILLFVTIVFSFFLQIIIQDVENEWKFWAESEASGGSWRTKKKKKFILVFVKKIWKIFAQSEKNTFCFQEKCFKLSLCPFFRRSLPKTNHNHEKSLDLVRSFLTIFKF